MPDLDGREVRRCLQSHAKFRATLAGTGGDDKWQIKINDRLVAYTKMSRGHTKTRTISAHLVSQMAQQLKVNTRFFAAMVGCERGWRDYVLDLHTQGHITAATTRTALGLKPDEPIPQA